ncbi:MAG: CPBP family intramembrane metalloprotease [Candidatus Moeniiplasma glomeromycotorum]|nr:CPBP family intramembrane metalloprotease [Candidatus Moeniiplasma glomeromycotorum]MCE8167309.1 CPBP family intramembrane metalloprotease [Candidatus Moeniiplasma glomeromycotorum]MCE8168677.1 CPBP family intramembrane metalloprotease [Candidatus Moeniiplasma glomeromycotorum]
MNLLQKSKILQQVLIQLPMAIAAVYVINRERKVIRQTLKNWWKWTWNWKIWPEERKNYYRILGVGVVTFFVVILLSGVNKKMREKNKTETEKEMVQQELITQKELDDKKEKEKQEKENFIEKKGRKPSTTPFYDYAPFFSFLTIVVVAPIVEECVFRYLVFEIFGKKNPLAYFFSATAFILVHWLNVGEIVNWWSVGILLITYLPMTIYFIYAYSKSKWNILYPIYAHLTWNLFVWLLAILVTYRTSS